MAINKAIIVCVVLLAVVGCSGQQVPVAANGVGAQAKDFSHEFVSVVLPRGVDLDMPYRVVEERIFTKKDGEMRRGLSLELTESNAQDAFSQIASAFAAGGFKQKGKSNMKENGRVYGTFRKKGQADYYVQASPASGNEAENANTTSHVWISWQIRSALQDEPKTQETDASP